ncbi:MAG TPA: hypothetical protein H9729_05225 [Candidatus Borkfalkia excrementigallinarum]|uniref:Uncharacterized protein n=1 Tax=Candidatus Borkfalkia excrementigallinarum TaxID=2838506 RepID=A0A9D1ZV63_9FIRM|nr:hypothetical protein [Candidatus Borkfalkia excrementigallinarum]
MFEKLFKKKPKDKAIIKFWQEFESRADLYADILAQDAEDSDDFIWMKTLVGKGLKLCCIDSTVGYEFEFEASRDPVRLVFHHMNDEYLKQVGQKLEEYYPSTLSEKIGFAVAE